MVLSSVTVALVVSGSVSAGAVGAGAVPSATVHGAPDTARGRPVSVVHLRTLSAREVAAELRVTDGVCTGWTPRAPVRLYYAEGDEQAVNGNSEHCQASFRARGVEAPLVDLGTPDYGGSRHLGSQRAATAAVVRWFTSLS